ncbi:type II toxin-antitoxin system HigB family toxin [uncultured Desulfobacter sp.]|uniref:type II toxin-antitoxin system HigB family toxin n=1 Tax=uncultured Desulfobacter sp. TaxID=240139 RepID=UPI002AAACE8C|nr:type II toxin-antitoxin system HigB family toxin [uncultured Desulfobacter sp.]
MHIIARPQLIKFYQREGCQDAKGPIDAWWHEAKRANWQSWTEIKAQYGSASILKGNRVVFNLAGNKYRLVVKINFPAQTVYIRFVGTHKEYDKINAEEI